MKSDAFKQMRMFNPAVANQADDYIDALAGAISAEPIYFSALHGQAIYDDSNNWMPHSKQFEVLLDF